MTAADLDKVLKTNSVQACVDFFAEMSEAKRKLLAPRANAWLRVVIAEAAESVPIWWNRSPSSEKQKKAAEELELLRKELPADARDVSKAECCRIAVLATGMITDLKKLGEEGVPSSENAYLVLANRKPKWLEKWMKMVCKEKTFTHWLLIRRLEREGLAEIVPDSNYWCGMAMGLPQTNGGLMGAFSDDPELLSLLWRMMEDEPSMLLLSGWPNVLAPEGSYYFRANLGLDTHDSRKLVLSGAADAWAEAIPHLVASDNTAKRKLNDSIVYWLNRLGSDDQESAEVNLEIRFQWFCKVFSSLEKDDDLRRQNLPRLVGLLNSPNRFAIRWAIEKLSGYESLSLPVEDIGVAMGNLFRIKGKEHAAEALALLRKMSEPIDADRRRIACIAIEGLEHSSQEIHRKSLDLIEKLGGASDSVVATELKERLSCLSGLLRERADGIVRHALGVSGVVEEIDEGTDSLGSYEELKSRINQLDDSIRKLAAIEDV
ncbi:MAG: hypothetical protein K2Z81_01100, partial [Cyanobacteria bacterium]|nr:hypothetical protein [Cyanobacteriota bacterium]